jgi:uncharacterized membrane protein YphA (DoxX/SURF4 family)
VIDQPAVAFRFALGTIFFVSGIAKLPNLKEFEQVVREYRVVPARLSHIVVLAIPSAETFLGTCLLLGIFVQPAAIAVAALLATFTAALLLNLRRGRRLACGCFGTISPREISLVAVIRNFVFIGLAVVVSWSAPTVLSIDPSLNVDSRNALPTTNGLAMLITGSVAVFAASLVQELVAILRSQRSVERTVDAV